MFSPYTQNESRVNATDTCNTEPMTLGSPVSSPKSKTGQNYLPPYLFGETVSSPVGTTTWNSPRQASHFTSSPFGASPVSHYREQQLPYQPTASSSIISTPTATKTSGPPIQGLLYGSTSPISSFSVSQLDASCRTPALEASLNNSVSGILTPSKSFSVNNSVFQSPAQIDPFFTQGDALRNKDQLDESWVTVFGFPSASASYILQQFSQYGNIIEHKISPSGNWMHIRYQSKLQAKKALSKNGKVFGGNIMIGVKPCIEMDLMESAKENANVSQIDTILDVKSPPQRDRSIFNESVESPKPNLKNIRPLTQMYQSPTTATQSQTQKSSGIVSKALEYLWKT